MDNSPPKTSPAQPSYGSESDPIDCDDDNDEMDELEEEEKVPRSLKRERAGKGPLSFIDLVDDDEEIKETWRKFYNSLLCTETYTGFSDPRPSLVLPGDHDPRQLLQPDRHLPSVRQLPGSPAPKGQAKGKQ